MRTGAYGSPELGQFRESRPTYPVQVDFVIPASNSRLFAVPVVGYLTRLLFLIPHLLVISLLAIVVLAMQFVLWIPVLLTGRYPRWGYRVVGGYVRWSARINAYMFGLTDAYPPFQLKN